MNDRAGPGLVITGLVDDSVLYHELTRGLIELGDLYRSPGIERCVADLSGGPDAWLARRSPRFRRQWRRWHSEAAAAGIEIVDLTRGEGLMDRLVGIERQGWKGREVDGITSPTMQRMYRSMIERLSERGRLVASIARLDGADVGFILGGVRAGIYRGLQLSYAEAVADLSVGHILQAHQIRALSATPVHTYDLGMDIRVQASLGRRDSVHGGVEARAPPVTHIAVGAQGRRCRRRARSERRSWARSHFRWRDRQALRQNR